VTDLIRTVIADDEVLARRTIRALVAGAADLAVVAECRDGLETARAIAQHAPDLVFLDIQMPGLDGFGAVLRAGTPPVIVFVTAHERHAVRAFDVDAADYVLKPFDDERFGRAVVRARLEVQRRRLVALASHLTGAPPGAAGADRPPARLVVKDGATTELIDLAAIHCIRAEGYYAELVLADRTVLMREPLQDLEARLDPARFVRIHRSAIVNADRLVELQPTFHGEYRVVLKGGAELTSSRGYSARLQVLARSGRLP